MNKGIILFFVLIFISFAGCGESSYDKHMKRSAEERQKFEQNISDKQRELISEFLSGEMKYAEDFNGIHGGFYCLWKQRDVDIYPHLYLIDKFKTNGYAVTTNGDSLNFIIISESISHKVGKYTNGGDATKLEVMVSVIDLKKKLAYTLNRVMGADPPSTIRRRSGSNAGGVGGFFGDEDIYNFITAKVLAK